MDTSATLFVRVKDNSITDDDLKTYYEQFGALTDSRIQTDKETKKSRGFAFIRFVKPSSVDEAMSCRPHEIKGITLEPRRAAPKEYSDKPESRHVCKQIYVGKLKDQIDEAALKDYFSNYGVVEKVDIPVAKDSDTRRGFAVVNFDDYDPVDVCCFKRVHFIDGVRLEVSKYIAREEFQKLNNRFGNNRQNNGGIQSLINQVLGGQGGKNMGSSNWNKPARRPTQQNKDAKIPFKSKGQNNAKGFQKNAQPANSNVDLGAYMEFLQGPPTLEKIMGLLNANKNPQQVKSQNGPKGKPQNNKQQNGKPQNNKQEDKPTGPKQSPKKNQQQNQNKKPQGGDNSMDLILSLLGQKGAPQKQQQKPAGPNKNFNKQDNRQQSDNSGGKNNDLVQLLMSSLGQGAGMSNGSGPMRNRNSNRGKGRKGVWM